MFSARNSRRLLLFWSNKSIVCSITSPWTIILSISFLFTSPDCKRRPRLSLRHKKTRIFRLPRIFSFSNQVLVPLLVRPSLRASSTSTVRLLPALRKVSLFFAEVIFVFPKMFFSELIGCGFSSVLSLELDSSPSIRETFLINAIGSALPNTPEKSTLTAMFFVSLFSNK